MMKGSSVELGGRMHEPVLSSSAGDLQASMRRNFRDLDIELETDVQSMEIGGLPLSLAQASITQDASGDTGSSTSRHTVAYYQAPDGRFPRFRSARWDSWSGCSEPWA